MPATKKARVTHNPSDVFVVTSSTTKDQIPRNVKRVRIDGSVSILSDNILRGPSLTEFFKGSSFLVQLIFDERVHTIGKNAFSNCKALAKVKLPSTLRVIMECAFLGCLQLTSIALPAGLEVIGKCAFYSTGLRSIDVPSTVQTIGGGAFAKCYELESVVLPPTLGVIEFELFYACHQLEEIEIPATIKAIEYYAFCGCSAVEHLDFSQCTQCLTIGYCAFSSCSSLLVIQLPPNLQGSIERGTFAHCSSLTHIRIPPRVNAIECNLQAHPFDMCSSLLSLELPEGLESIAFLPGPIGSFEFTGITRCPSLVNLYIPPTQQVSETSERSFGPDFLLGRVAYDWRDLMTRLQHRFDNLPLHRICYFHSHHSMEDSIRDIRAILQAQPNAMEDLDSFGMTPLHILALSQLPKTELIQELLTSVDAVLSPKDLFGCTPLDYLCKNNSQEGLAATHWLTQKVLDERSPFLGLDRWKQELLDLQEHITEAESASAMSTSVNSLLDTLGKLEFKEVLSLLEMKLWKMKLEQSRREQNCDRHCCRVHCGISIVIESILPFLGKHPTS